ELAGTGELRRSFRNLKNVSTLEGIIGVKRHCIRNINRSLRLGVDIVICAPMLNQLILRHFYRKPLHVPEVLPVPGREREALADCCGGYERIDGSHSVKLRIPAEQV